MRFALMPHAGSWAAAGVVAVAERYQHAALVVRGTGPGGDATADDTEGPAAEAGLTIEGDGVVLSALRRRGDWLELRVVAETPTATATVIRGSFDEAREADLLGRPMGALASEPGRSACRLGPGRSAPSSCTRPRSDAAAAPSTAG